MTHFNLLIKGGNVVSSTSVDRADVGVIDGTIAFVGDLEDGVTADRVIDARSQFVLPGVIDAHTHPVYADDLAGTAKAGASAGVTTMIAFVGAFPSWGFPKTTPSAVVEDYIRTWDGRPATDFALHVAFDNADDPSLEVPQLIEMGVTSFKFFMSYRKRGMMVDDIDLIAGLDAIAKAGGIAIVHAENGDGIDYMESPHWDSPNLPYGTFLKCHTELFEAEAVLRVIALADAVGCPLYIPHLSAAEGIKAIVQARSVSQIPVWVETCPHYLLLTNDDVIRRGALSKVGPPLREKSDNVQLWEAVSNGVVQVVATDHGGQTLERKSKGVNILQAAYGFEGIEHLLPTMFSDGVAGSRLTVQRLAAVLAENPAKIFGLEKKGRVSVGMDADLVIVDPTGHAVCSAETHVSASDYCTYEGHELKGRVRYTIRRGSIVLDDTEFVQEPSGGRFIPRAPIGKRPMPTVDNLLVSDKA